MCGIAGIHSRARERPVGSSEVSAMLDLLAHRGPDEEGVHVEGRVGLGNRRLAIIDPDGSRQPITNEDGTVVVVCNGEIYNYREIRRRLQARGHRFSTHGDAEVLVHLYEDLGEDLVHELRGMFAFAIWDRPRQRVLLARDRLGIKPLYVREEHGRLAFASEIKALFADGSVARRVDLDGLVQYLARKFVPAPQTLFQGISALPPGHLLTSDERGTEIRRWWRLSFQPGPEVDERANAEHLRSLLVDAVRSHLVSDVPFGAFLSGGIDSSTIVALMSEELSAPVRTYAVGYEGEDAWMSETPFARLVAQRFGTDHHEVMLTGSDLVERMPGLLWHLDQPIADEACLPNLLVSQLAARDVKMVLTGEGGDELFAGYARYQGERWSRVATATPAAVRRAVVWGLEQLPNLRRPKLALRAVTEPDEARRLIQWFPLFDDARLRSLLSADLRAEIDLDLPARCVRAALDECDSVDQLARMLYLDSTQWLPDDLLARGDKTSMAASLEARVPLLDHPLVEFAASLPADQKIRGSARKYLLRRVAEEWLPAEILQRPKKGFPTPVARWFRDEARSFLHDNLDPTRIERRGFFDPRAVSGLLADHDRGHADHGSLLFGLLSLELWMQALVDEPHGSPPSCVIGRSA